MAIEFRNVNFPPLVDFSAAAPDGSIAGVIGGALDGIRCLLRLGAGWEWIEEGEVVAGSARRYLNSLDDLDVSPVDSLFIEHTFGMQDALTRMRAFAGLERLRRNGATILIASNEQELLLRLCDEIWWLEEGKLAAKGDPREVLEAYNRRVAQRFRQESAGDGTPALSPSMRRGDGRAELAAIEVIGEDGRPTLVLRSGENATVRVRVRFQQDVADPVVGILIRTRIGMEVYGTNTELEGLKLGPRQAGETVRTDFRFRCDLCPREYTLTAASHDPDGVWHDWAEDALAFSVAGARYTAGVADLGASVEFALE
ncbi:MAG: Wzt carbohydrate-binding domain-containing protein [Acidobacteriota bacterium]